MRSLPAVSCSAHSIRSTICAGTGAPRRPMKRSRTPSSCSSGVSRSMYSANIRTSALTSSIERDQFSVENA